MNIEVIKRIKADVTKHQRQGEIPNRIIIITNKGNDVIYDATVKENHWYIDEDLGCVVLDSVNEHFYIRRERTHNVKYIDIKEIAVINFQYSIPTL